MVAAASESARADLAAARAELEDLVRIPSISADPERVRDWLNWPADEPTTIDFTFVAPHGTPGLLAVTFETPDGEVTV